MGKHRRTELLIPFVQVSTDFLAINGAFWFSYWLRFESIITSLFPVTKGIPDFFSYFLSGIVVSVVWIFVLKRMGFYGVRRDVRLIDEFVTIVKGVGLGMLIITSATFFYREFSYSRLVFLYIWITSTMLLLISRACINQLERSLHRKKVGLLNAVIVGANKWGEGIYDKIQFNIGLGFHVVGHVGGSSSLAEKAESLGPISQIARVVKTHSVDAIFIAFSEEESGYLLDIINACTGLDVEFYMIPDLLDVMTSRLRIKEIEGIPVLRIKDVTFTGWYGIFKRIFDIFVAVPVAALMLPVGLLIALVLKLETRGPLFYSQKRIGLDGRAFNLHKFRTMIHNAERKTGPVWTQENDPRVTRVGRFLRRTSMDELPQIYNVLKGEMSLVGPRPERPHFVDKFKHKIPKYLERHRVKSGMTGWAQVNGLRGNVPIEERTKYDIYYVENWSLVFDIKIIIMTIWTIIQGENSY